MSDDIDIEEHDVMDNPRIKNIFPDIASIKTEVIDYEEETLPIEADYQEDAVKYENYEYLDEYEAVPIEYEDSDTNMHHNKIILGSKPCTVDADEETLPTIQECSIVLEDWGPVLENSPFCHKCNTLFPTENALDSHKMVAHSFLVALSKNKAVKSTSRSSISAINFASTSKDVVCHHCNVIFPNETALLKHSYELLPSKFDLGKQTVVSQETPNEGSSSSSSSYLSCYICSCVFIWKGHLFHHLQKFHGVTCENFPLTPVPNLKCRFCPSIPVSTKAYNGHIYYRHRDLYFKTENIPPPSVVVDNFKCELCNTIFATAAAIKIHTATQHKAVKKPKSSAFTSVKPAVDVSKPVSEHRRPIPKCTLYSCNKCQIHFVSCTAALEHSKKCTLTRGDWKCKQCRRSFKMADKCAHLRQHELSERFKVIKIRNRILDRVLCRCTSCNVCFDERSLFKYHSFSCSQHKSTYCSICQIDIHEHAYKRHSRVHTELSHKQNFIIINYIFYDDGTRAETREVSKLAKPPKQRKEVGNYLYYCPSCKLYMKMNKACDNHTSGKCNKNLPKCLCKVCGLWFSKKCYKTHQEYHRRMPSMRLKDIAFRNIQTGKRIDPPFPLFKKCKKCKVCFFSGMALRNHVCDAEDVKNCDYCGDKMSDLAYKLHVPFHEYRKDKKLDAHIPELIKKYESLKSIWNILFLCETCDTVFDAYDEVVEHCQDHFCNMENYNVIVNHCDICDLKFLGKSYERHQNLHSANDINRNSFTIINCNYDVLLFDAWTDIFEVLAPEQVDQILQKSIYKEIRNMRMSVLVDKNTDLIIYKCGICKTIVDSGSISHHAQDRNNCVRITKFSCSICNFRFYSNKSLQSHQELHNKLLIDENSFKIISFNHEKDAYVNDSLKSISNSETLKFIRCQHCGKLINKSKYPKHIMYHKTLEKKKTKDQPKSVVLSKRKFQAVENPVNIFYRCMKCDVCVSKQNIKVHYCSKDKYKRQCPECGLWFRVSSMQKHETYHQKYSFSKKNVEIINFRDGKEVGDRKDMDSKVVLCQCAECGVCLHNKSNIIKHRCVDKRHFKTCPHCEVPFRYSHYYIHQQYHETKTFSKHTITIMMFNPLIRSKVPLIPNKFKDNSTARLAKPKPADVTKILDARDFDDSSESSSQIITTDNEVNCELSLKTYFKRIMYRYFRCQKCNIFFVTASALVDHDKSCNVNVKSVICDCGLTFHAAALDLHKTWQKCGPAPETSLYIITLISFEASEFELGKCLYKCKVCNIYYLSLTTVLKHFEDGHYAMKDPVECKTCKIYFSSISNTKHNNIHHKQNKWSKTDLFRLEIETMTLGEAMSLGVSDQKVGVPGFAERAVEEMKTAKRKIVDADLDVSNKIVNTDAVNVEKGAGDSGPCSSEVYTCDICKLNFLNKSTLASHYSLGRHKRTGTVNCGKCGLTFTLQSLKRHLNSPVPSPKKTDDTSIDSEITDTTLPVCAPQTESVSRLFKCGECDVYFFTQETCNDHMTDHQALDPTEYIACKICELQFLCENLGKHMRGHRNSSFNIDDLVVKEFHPNKETVDTYLALDRLKSKAVSTTTHFDNEDEKNEVDTTNVDS